MFAAIIRIEQSSRVCRARLCDCNDTSRWRLSRSLDLVVAAESKADFGVDEANNGEPLSETLYRLIRMHAPCLSTVGGEIKMSSVIVVVPRNQPTERFV